MPAPKPIEAVTVTGKRRTERELIETVIAPFVIQHAARDPKTGLLVRGPSAGVCQITLGLSQGFDDFVTARITEVARRVGAVVQPIGRCRPNVQVAFTTDPQDLVNHMVETSRGAILGYHVIAQERALIRVTRPIQAWYATGTLNAVPSTFVQFVGADPGTMGTLGGVMIDRNDGSQPYSGLGSRLTPRNSSQIVNVLIVADLDKLDGHEIGPVADYIAMLALSQMKSLDACGELPSILDLMASDCPRPSPQALTDGDLAFLKALYASDITISGAHGRDRVEHGMVKALEGAGP